MNTIIILSLLLKAAVSIPDADDQLHIYALPVGQGDCTVIQCPTAEGDPDAKGMVSIIDAGSSTDNVGLNAKDIVDFLATATLHLVVITHSDKDHISYLDPILNKHKEYVSVHHPCQWNEYTKYIKSEYADPQQVLDCHNIENCAKKLNLCPNYQPKFGRANSVTLSFVASAVGGCKNNRANNEDSLIAKITYAGRSTLITGDFELDAEPMTDFLEKARVDLKSDIHVYRLSHHGAYNNKANWYKFLNAVGASYVFSSSGFKLPTKAVDNHNYTCFDGNDIDKNKQSSRAIYVTHLFRGEGVMHWFISYYLLRFDIARNGGIGVNFKPLGDTNLPFNEKCGNMKMDTIIILSLLLKAAVSIPDADNQLHIYALPVGQGDCTVIQCPKAKGGPVKGVVSIIDAGASNRRGIDGEGVINFLAGTKLNFAVITHSHRDHFSYMKTILDYYGTSHYKEYGTLKKFTVYHSCDWSQVSC
uniref:Metallo-beta-lactamase domain-containing protein n=1 Tax=Amphimedon queenslandica TaxID=400682 RepID=A0A1X7SUH8_AMPQE